MKKTIEAKQQNTIALVGNPNSGKTSIFNLLTGLQQKTGNFPGITVDKKVGKLLVEGNGPARLIDFPGTYSFYPNAQDERLVVQSFCNPKDPDFPDAFIYIADLTKLDKHLLLFSQIKDLGKPVILALNMADLAEKESCNIDFTNLSKRLNVPVVLISGRTGIGRSELMAEIGRLPLQTDQTAGDPFRPLSKTELNIAQKIKPLFPGINDYQAILIAHHHEWLAFLDKNQRQQIAEITRTENFQSLQLQVEDTMYRFNRFTPMLKGISCVQKESISKLTEKMDAILTHKILGPLIFFAIMFSVFQAIFIWATYPMDWIDAGFGWIVENLRTFMPDTWITHLITDGLLAGLGGILVFVPQIAILFFLISLLEEAGYMARVVYLFDSIMQRFGLNGRSLIALISSSACAIPAIMSTRTISNWKERLITIMITPLISCSARIPVYTVLIGFAFPAKTIAGVFNLQGLAFMGLYLLGIVFAFLFALIFKWILRSSESSFLLLELPDYKLPLLRNVGLNVWSKVRAFVVEAGKIILLISMILWVLANFGPKGQMEFAEQEALSMAASRELSTVETENLIASKKLEYSFAGQLGKSIEPVVRPLGFDWKIGIAIITSFAAREVFVGTMATIYSIGSDADEFSVREQMARERDPVTGAPVYNTATSVSLLVFYVFAMMCMGTMAVVRRETGSWKWPILQFVFMTGMAYLSSFLVYHWLS
ncbi:MAG: ferrous iron transport protein B [Saprospiraceae bacterium]|nr:ferrous iron transport protein B [Saprospiraceae bacterium]MCB9324541.1 ferrous iron transport protein B [Lewinellaceae bacterium]